MSGDPRITMRMSEKRLEEIDSLVGEGLFKSRSEAIRALVARSLDDAKANGPIQVKVTRSISGRKYSGATSHTEEDHRESIIQALENHGGEIPQRELPDETDISQGHISQILGRMEEDNEIDRRPDPNSARAKIVSLPEDVNPTEESADGVFYATRKHGRNSGVLHTWRNCWHIADVPDEDIIDGPRSAFDSDQPICGICKDRD